MGASGHHSPPTSTPDLRKKEAEEKGEQSRQVDHRLDFQDIRSNMEQMTEVQFDQYRESLVGRRVWWHGWVEDVNEKLFFFFLFL